MILGGQKYVLRGAKFKIFFALRANLFFALRARDLAPPSQNPVDAPVYVYEQMAVLCSALLHTPELAENLTLRKKNETEHLPDGQITIKNRTVFPLQYTSYVVFQSSFIQPLFWCTIFSFEFEWL